MELTDKIAGIGFLGSFGAYFANMKYHFFDRAISPNLYDWTIGGLPEFFTGMAAVSLADIVAKKVGIKSLIPAALAAGSLVGFGFIDETVYNISNGYQDITDVFKYALGSGAALVGKKPGSKRADNK
jgi:hypothetical protein